MYGMLVRLSIDLVATMEVRILTTEVAMLDLDSLSLIGF